MAKLTISTPDDLIKQLEKMGDLDKVVPKMLQAAASPVEKAVKKNLQKHNQTNELHDSITTSKPKKGKDGVWSVRITSKGYDKKTGVANSIKLIAIEYGTSDQDATPVIRPSIIANEEQSIAAMQEVFERETGLKK